jgi:DNA-binding protein YbaB
MGVLDLPKLALKARKMQSQMQSIKAVGKSGVIGLIINGVYTIVEIEPDFEELKKRFPGVPEDSLRKIVTTINNDTKKAVEDAKSQLQKEMASSTSLDDLKGMLN